MSELLFHKIINGTIFTSDFGTFVSNNTVSFDDKSIVVIYGPNGTGKTSLVRVFEGAEGTSYSVEYDNTEYTENNSTLFHIIQDQSSRNIIKGTAKDFLLGDDIQREFILAEYISNERNKVISDIIATLKSTFGISSSSSKMLDSIDEAEGKALIKDLANAKSKGSRYQTSVFISIIENLPETENEESEEGKMAFLIKDLSDKNSLIKRIRALVLDDFEANPHVHEIEENTEAMHILEKYSGKSQCIVCDSDGIDSAALLERKTQNREHVIMSISERLREAVESVISLASNNDPFNIKSTLLQSIDSGNVSLIQNLKNEFDRYCTVYKHKLYSYLKNRISESDIKSKQEEYERIISERPTISSEDLLYIEGIISDSMGKTLRIDRDENNTLRISLANQDFLNVSKDELPLSTGEQNFLSLCFEFLKAKNSPTPIVVIDDPISSFDSIYKNKIVFALVRMLKDKNRIILTHNTDVLRLLNSQYSNCFSLYILNNTNGENNGFINLRPNEKDMLINIDKLLNGFRKDVVKHVISMEEYLISMIPFCRGYATIINNTTVANNLTNVMHGYKRDEVDIAQSYCELFGNETGLIPNSYSVKVEDILRKNPETIEILDAEVYPLLNKTLKHTMTYLMLRLLVEKTLVEKKHLEITQHLQLGQIIDRAFPNNSLPETKMRVRLTSKKTLINEFNHFEGNLSIFQPAIDITNSSLAKEKNDILNAMESINNGIV